MKRFLTAAVCILLLFSLTGCFEKDFDKSVIVLRGAKNLNFEAGETKTVTAELPQLDGAVLTAATSDEALRAGLSADNTLTLACDTAGDYVLTLRLTAKGYRPLEVKYPVKVTLKSMAVSVLTRDGTAADAAKGLTLYKGGTQALIFSGAPENAVYSVQNDNPAALTAEQRATGVELTALSPGKATLQFSVACEGYEPFSVQLPVTVEKTAALLTLSQQSVSGTTQQTLSVRCTAYQPGGKLSVTAADPAVMAVLNGDTINISAARAGSFSIAVCCEAEGYHTATQTVSAAFTMPPVPMSLPSSVTLSLGQTKEVAVTRLPGGAKLSLSGGNSNIAFQNSNGAILIEGKAVGSANITVTANCTGYADSRITLPVTISAVSYSASSKYNSYVREIVALVNEERTSRGLSTLVYLPELEGACQTRAKEASVVWDHTRPDGRSWKTVLTDMDYAYYAAGENLLGANVLKSDSAVDAWMDSPGHRENILRAEFTGTCVGIVQGSDGDYYYAQLFITKE